MDPELGEETPFPVDGELWKNSSDPFLAVWQIVCLPKFKLKFRACLLNCRHALLPGGLSRYTHSPFSHYTINKSHKVKPVLLEVAVSILRSSILFYFWNYPLFIRTLQKVFLLVSWKLTSLPLYAFFSLLDITRRAMICCLMKVSGLVMSTSTSGLLIWLVSPSFMISGKYLIGRGREREQIKGEKRDLNSNLVFSFYQRAEIIANTGLGFQKGGKQWKPRSYFLKGKKAKNGFRVDFYLFLTF